MKLSFTKTTILVVCTALGLTIGIGSAFGQKLADQSQVKGEIPIDQPKFIPKKQLVPEHLKPKQTEELKETDPPKVKGEKPVDVPKKQFEQRERLVPENSSPETKQPSSKQSNDQKPARPKDQKELNEQKTENHEPTQEKPILNQKEDEPIKEKEEKKESSVDEKLPSSEQKKTNRNESSSSEQQSPKEDQKQDPPSSQNEQSESDKTNSKNEEGHEIEIPEKVEVESSDGRKVDVTSVIEDIFGEVNASKEETEEIQKKMENHQHPTVSMQKRDQLSNEKSQQTQEDLTQDDVHEPPRTEKHGIMPMTASNDLHGVIIGLGMATAGICYVLFRKGE